MASTWPTMPLTVTTSSPTSMDETRACCWRTRCCWGRMSRTYIKMSSRGRNRRISMVWPSENDRSSRLVQAGSRRISLERGGRAHPLVGELGPQTGEGPGSNGGPDATHEGEDPRQVVHGDQSPAGG